ncbi:cereblon family protein [uncultured Desulfosarcina sp.]|uniref:cereblon family protein n=1 Tax=uncultured Desulfosarcina sp. TaxID=218289 RepID=UPI0029C7C36B|nr:cereblon family protein [uncultured Desulfosarcina sp.]
MPLDRSTPEPLRFREPTGADNSTRKTIGPATNLLVFMHTYHDTGRCYQPAKTDSCRCLHLFRPIPKPEKTDSKPSAADRDRAMETPEDAIVCRRCLHEITSPVEIREINGAHTHTFANPEGIIFEIGCYRDARGCGYIGPPSTEFTWFSGYTWRIAVCGNCHSHLGWLFSAPDGRFFHGLITSRISAKEK